MLFYQLLLCLLFHTALSQPGKFSNVDFNAIRPLFEETYKYIVVGAGTAGCVVAARLSEKESNTVLALEAGPSDDIPQIRALTEVPFAQNGIMNGPLDWAFKTEPQKYGGKALINRTSLFHAGRVQGGTSSVNGMQYVRGAPENFNAWEAAGNRGWGYQDVLKYFKKSELNLNPGKQMSGFHGVQGPWVVSDNSATPELDRVFVEAGKELGYDEIDVNGPDQYGFGILQSTGVFGRRMSTSTAFLKPVMGRRNLKIKTLSTVIKIIIHRRKAKGVIYADATGALHYIRATKEVIISAGTILSPKVLMLSGIGPKEHLQSFGIKVIKDLPVGNNLKDHVVTDLPFFINKSIGLNVVTYATFQAMQQYQFEGRGPWTSTGLVDMAFFNTGNTSQAERPAKSLIEFVAVLYANSRSEVARKYINYDTELWDSIHTNLETYRDGIVFNVGLTNIRQAGTVRLRSPNPADNPKIEMNYLGDPLDVKDMIENVRFVHNLAQTDAFQAIGATPTYKVYPGCTEEVWNTDAYWECYVKHDTITGYHYTSTCKMGNGSDAVVDDQLRVHDIKGLRVADASIMPDVVSGNTMATTVMIAEKAADMIKGIV